MEIDLKVVIFHLALKCWTDITDMTDIENYIQCPTKLWLLIVRFPFVPQHEYK